MKTMLGFCLLLLLLGHSKAHAQPPKQAKAVKNDTILVDTLVTSFRHNAQVVKLYNSHNQPLTIILDEKAAIDNNKFFLKAAQTSELSIAGETAIISIYTQQVAAKFKVQKGKSYKVFWEASKQRWAIAEIVGR